MPRKRTRDEMEASEPEEKEQERSLLQRIRNMWEFASVMQFIFMFGKAVKIDEDFDIEVRRALLPSACTALDAAAAEYIRRAEWLTYALKDFENECLKLGHSEKLEEIGLTLLKWISSHRGLKSVTQLPYHVLSPD